MATQRTSIIRGPGSLKCDVITLYGYRVYRGWLSEADILRMRDLDVEPLRQDEVACFDL